jgi:hypothetical protein
MHKTFILRRLQRCAQHLHALGPVAVAGLIEDSTTCIGGLAAGIGLLAKYETKPTRTLIRASLGPVAEVSR